MELTEIRELYRNREKYIGKEVTVGGWIRSNRDSKNFGFLVINDGTFFEPLQIVYGDGLSNFQELCKINVGAALVIRGTIVETPDAKQPFERQAAEVLVEGASTADYPSPAAKDEHIPGGIPGALPDRFCNPQLFHGKGVRVCALASDHGQ